METLDLRTTKMLEQMFDADEFYRQGTANTPENYPPGYTTDDTDN